MAPVEVLWHSFLPKILQSGKFSDCSITVEGAVFKLHKCVVCTQSPVLEAALKGGFKEAQDSNIKSDFELEHILALVTFFYSGSYNPWLCIIGNASKQGKDIPKTSPTAEAIAMFNIKVSILADYYQVPALGQMARIKLSFEKINQPSAVARIISAVDGQCNDLHLHQKVVHWMISIRDPFFGTKEFEELELSSEFQLRLIHTLSSTVGKCGHCLSSMGG